jgi:hypothetical protein
MHLQPNDNLPESLFLNPVWHALHAKHRRFGNSTVDACRYPADVVPFAAVNAPSADAMRQLHALLAPGESTWLIGEQYGLVSWLHVGCANHRAVKLYLGMGFQQVREVTLHRILRKDSPR